mgnify:CR=1 FL=1
MSIDLGRRQVALGLGGLLLFPTLARSAQGAIEKPQITIAVGGKAVLYYLPLTLAERLGYFKAEGLDVTVPDFAGGAKALQALVGGSTHSANMAAMLPIIARLLKAATLPACRPMALACAQAS